MDEILLGIHLLELFVDINYFNEFLNTCEVDVKKSFIEVKMGIFYLIYYGIMQLVLVEFTELSPWWDRT